MALTKEDLLAIAELMDDKLASALTPINQRLDKMDARLDKVDARLDKVDARLDKVDARLDKVDARLDTMQEQINALQEDMDEVKENTTITRSVVNELGEWAEAASRTLDIRYPLWKAE